MNKNHFSWPSFLLGVLTAFVCITAVAAAGLLFAAGSAADRPDSVSMYLKIREMERIIRMKYLEEADEQQQADRMLQGMVSGLSDPYAAYYTREEYEEIRRGNKGYRQGIGITIRQHEDGSLVIESVLKGYPAEEAGLREGDVLLAIDGEDLAGKTSADAASLIMQSEGESVNLRIRRMRESDAGKEEQTASEEYEELEITVQKGELEITSVDGGLLSEVASEEQLQALEKAAGDSPDMLLSEIGYISISGFNGTTSEQFRSLYTDLKYRGIKALIIDLRENLGGTVEGCCDTARQILPEGVIVYEKDRSGPERSRDCDGASPIDIPLALLVNGHTASAAEIFAGAVQDYEIGTVIGSQTYGKGVEQNSYALPDGSVLKLTTTNYYTPDHHDLNEVGITPDIEIEQTPEDTTDRQAEKAVEVLERRES